MPVVYSSVGWYCLVALVISSREDNGVKALASSAGWKTAWRQKGECLAKKSGRKGTQSLHIHIQSWYLSSCYQLNNFFVFWFILTFSMNPHVMIEEHRDDTVGEGTSDSPAMAFLLLLPETKTCLSSSIAFLSSGNHYPCLGLHQPITVAVGNCPFYYFLQVPCNSGISCIFKLIQILTYVFKVMLKHLSGKKSEESYYCSWLLVRSQVVAQHPNLSKREQRSRVWGHLWENSK